MTDIITSPIGTMPIIPVDTDGKFTPGAAFAIDSAAQLINAAWSQANDKFSTFEAKIDSIETTWLSGLTTPHITAPTTSAPTVAEPGVTIADTSNANIMNLFDSKYAELVALLSDKFSTFITTFFPNEPATYGAAESYVKSAILNTTDPALPTAIADKIWNDDKARILADANRAVVEATEQWAARRYPLPPGALTYQTMEIQQKAQEEIAKSARAAAIKNWDTTYDKIMTSVKLALSNRTSALQAASDYIKSLASGPDIASRIVNIGYDAQSKMISAAAQFYSARTSAAELAYKANATNAGMSMEASKSNQAADLTIVEDRLKALLAECQALAQMATSLYNNLHAEAGSRYSVSA